MSDLITIKCKGKEVKCTPEHLVAVYITQETWCFKKAKDVRPEDVVIFV